MHSLKNTPIKRMISKLEDVIDIGNHQGGQYHLLAYLEGKILFVERIENGRPVAMTNQNQSMDFIRNTSKDAKTMHSMLVAEYARYGSTGLYPDFHANLWLVQTVDIPSFTFHTGSPI